MAGMRRLMMPNTVLLQHTDADCYDLLIIAEPLHGGYRLGVPSIGKNIHEVIEWIARLDIINQYQHIRTIGCSAGGYPAVIAGYRLNAQMAFSVGGRFHSERHPFKILDRVLTTWRAVRKGRCSRVLMSYAIDKSRDRFYAKVIARLTGGSMIAVEFTDEKVGHRILERLAGRSELTDYLNHTIFASMSDELIATTEANVIMNFPSTQIRTYQ